VIVTKSLIAMLEDFMHGLPAYSRSGKWCNYCDAHTDETHIRGYIVKKAEALIDRFDRERKKK
jgi:hypothetical protein